jgi:hypothetical protein
MFRSRSLPSLLIIWTAGGAAYYFAKQSINADRQVRHEAELKRKRKAEALEYAPAKSAPEPSGGSVAAPGQKLGSPNVGPPGEDNPRSAGQKAGSAAREASGTEWRSVYGKSKYEASEPYRTRKGDRFS